RDHPLTPPTVPVRHRDENGWCSRPPAGCHSAPVVSCPDEGGSMDFQYPPEAEAFRAELRAWLEANLTDDDRRATRGGYEGGGYDFEAARAWARKLHDGGWACVAWPEEYGGRGATAIQQMVFEEEMARS